MLASGGGNISVLQQSAGLMANAGCVQITGGSFVDIGGDMVNHYHISHGPPPASPLEAILAMLPAANFGQKHQDTLAKWTEGTLLWVFEHRLVIDWFVPNGTGLLWGTGMRTYRFSLSPYSSLNVPPEGAGKTIMAYASISLLFEKGP
jgi:hypothetical protein